MGMRQYDVRWWVTPQLVEWKTKVMLGGFKGPLFTYEPDPGITISIMANPDHLDEFKGRQILRAWHIGGPSADLILKLEGNVCIAFDPDPPLTEDHSYAVLKYGIRCDLPEEDFAELDDLIQQTPLTEHLARRMFEGFTNNMLVFGDLAAVFTPGLIRWCCRSDSQFTVDPGRRPN